MISNLQRVLHTFLRKSRPRLLFPVAKRYTTVTPPCLSTAGAIGSENYANLIPRGYRASLSGGFIGAVRIEPEVS